MTTTTINFRERIKQEFNVSDSQLDACQRWERGNGSAFYTVESASIPETYRVEWNADHHCLQCLPHSGPRCKAATAGMTCWHLRAAVASDRLFKYEVAQARRREAEATEREIAEAEALVNGEREAAKREASATKRSGARAYERQAFNLYR